MCAPSGGPSLAPGAGASAQGQEDNTEPMRLIERYIFSRAFKIAAASLLAALAMAWTTQVLARINLVTDSGQTAGTFLELATMLLPAVIPVVMPFAIVIGITQVLSTMNQDSELAVIAAAGSPRSTLIKPMMLLAVMGSIIAFFVHNVVEPAARYRVREILATAHADLLSSAIQEGNFQKIADGLFVQVAQRLPDGRLGGIFVADSRQQGVDLNYYSKLGEIVSVEDQRILYMTEGEVHRKSPGGDVSVIRFASYALDLSEFAPGSKEIFLFPKDQTLAYLLNPDPDDSYLKKHPLVFRAEIHRRFTEWSFSIVFALIALAAAGDARSHRQARLHPMVTAIAFAMLVRWEGYFAANKAQSSEAFVPVVYAVPVVNAAFACYFIATNRVMAIPITWTERLFDAAHHIAERARSLRLPFRRAATQEGRP